MQFISVRDASAGEAQTQTTARRIERCPADSGRLVGEIDRQQPLQTRPPPDVGTPNPPPNHARDAEPKPRAALGRGLGVRRSV